MKNEKARLKLEKEQAAHDKSKKEKSKHPESPFQALYPSFPPKITKSVSLPVKCGGGQHVKSKNFNCAARYCNLKPVLCEACAKKSNNETDKKGKPLLFCKLCWIGEKQNNSFDSDS